MPLLKPDAAAIYQRIRWLAVMMDGAFRLPGTRLRFGLNSVIGLPPGAGDTVLALVSLWIVWQASELGLPRAKLARMAGNVLIETMLGAIPLLGDLLDVAWKANLRNLRIIDDYIGRPDRTLARPDAGDLRERDRAKPTSISRSSAEGPSAAIQPELRYRRLST